MRARLAEVMRQSRQVWTDCLEGGALVGLVYGGVIGVLLGSLSTGDRGLLPTFGILLLSGCLGALLGAVAGAVLGGLAGCVTGGIVVGAELLMGGDALPEAMGSRRGPSEVVPARLPAGRGDEASPAG